MVFSEEEEEEEEEETYPSCHLFTLKSVIQYKKKTGSRNQRKINFVNKESFSPFLQSEKNNF